MNISFRVFTELYYFNLYVVTFDVPFISIDNALMCTA